jgi:RAP1 GTPase activating protein 1
MAISVIKDDTNYKVLVRSTTGSERLMVPTTSVQTSFFRKLFGMGPSLHDIMLAASPAIPAASLSICKDTNLPNELLSMEERQVIRSYKFGLCYVAPGQTTEEEMFANNFGINLLCYHIIRPYCVL